MISSVSLVIVLLLTHEGPVTSLTCIPDSVCSEESCDAAHDEFETDCPSKAVNADLLGNGDNCGTCLNQEPGKSLPKPSDLSLTVRPYSTEHFELVVSWSPPSNVQGLLSYRINIIAASVSTPSGTVLDERFQYGCHCAPSNVTEKIFQVAYSYQNHLQQCDWNVTRRLGVEVFSVPYSPVSDIAAKDSVPWPTDCLSIVPPNYSICGPPIPSFPDTTVVVELLPSPSGFMKATFEWEESGNVVPGYQPSEYYIVLRQEFSETIHEYRARNATSITILPLDATTGYYTYIQVYLPCPGSQSCTNPNLDYSCGDLYSIGLIKPSPDPPASSAVSYSHTLTTSASPSSSLPPPSLPTTGGDYPTSTTTDSIESSSITVVEALVVGGSCVIGVVVVMLLLMMTMVLVWKRSLCSKKRRGQSRIPGSPCSPPDSERSTPNNLYSTYLVGNEFAFPDPISPSPKPGVQQLQKLLHSPSPKPDLDLLGVQLPSPSPNRDEWSSTVLCKSDQHRVVFIYSDQTPKEDCDLIAAYRTKLESQGDIITSIYDISLRQPTSTWLAQEVQVANTIFCVCNKEFLHDWQKGGGRLSRSPVHALKLQVDSHVNSSLHPAMLYAVVVLCEKDIQFVPEGSYLKAAVNFLLCREKLGEMMRFIRREHEYTLVS